MTATDGGVVGNSLFLVADVAAYLHVDLRHAVVKVSLVLPQDAEHAMTPRDQVFYL